MALHGPMNEVSPLPALADAQLGALMTFLQPVAIAVRDHFQQDPDRGERVLNRVGTSILHLDAARFGAKLYNLPHSSERDSKEIFSRLREDHVTLEAAANNLVFRGVATALDLCAAAIQHLFCEPLKNDKEADICWWFEVRKGRAMKGRAMIETIPDARYSGWLRSTIAPTDWKVLKQGRDHLTHRVVARHVTSSRRTSNGSDGEPVTPYREATTQMRIDGELYDLADLHPRVVRFGLGRWQEFCHLLHS